MLEKTFTFMRRLVHTSPGPEPAMAPAAVHDDRRLWIRYSANLSAQVQLANHHASTRVDAKVRDLSLGGANLLTDVPFPAGQMITLELATQSDELCTILACVVRSLPEGANGWSVGCIFSRELSNDELASFGAQRLKHGGEDQRIWKRFTCNLHAQYQVVGDPEARSYDAQVLNISASGMGLQLCHPLEAGCLLSLDLQDSERQLIRSILGCIVHTTCRTTGEIAVGCNFIRELAEDELLSLL
jgi:c-di-GMP-binding flagellar brake protein YcgR